MKIKNKYFIYDTPRKCGIKSILSFFITRIYLLFYGFIILIFHPKRKEKAKYKVSICAIFKNEAVYLKEWIEFHRIVGVEHFYLYNNNSNDNYMSVLMPYVNLGIVTLIDWEKQHAQMDAYANCIKKYAKDTEWLGFIDLDEFIVPNEDNDVYTFLCRFKNKPAVLMYWRVFGTSGLIERDLSGLVIEDFTVCWDRYSDMGKCFYNTKYSIDCHCKKNDTLHHRLWTKVININIPPVNVFNKIVVKNRNKVSSIDFPIQINHYFTKSYNEYTEKKLKGDVYFKLNPHDEEYFYQHEKKSKTSDFSAYKYLIELKKRVCDK